jgi:dipeptidyl aminopeptidase/acylaminoacyl peptidase
MGTRMRCGWPVVVACMSAAAGVQAADDHRVHRFLQVEISPDATLVAAVEGDSPINGTLPNLRELVIRNVKTGGGKPIPLPCGHVPQCWPGSPAWSPDNKHLSFTLRKPGSHSYGIYTVGSDGSDLTKQLDFEGTIGDLRYLSDGRLSMLATEGARKEVGATEAGAAVAGDLDAAPPEQRIAILVQGALHWASPPDLFVYEYDARPDDQGFVGTAAPGDGDSNWWTARLYAFSSTDGSGQVIYSPTDIRQQLADPKVSRDGSTVAFIAGIMSDFGSTGGDVYTLPLAGGAAPTNITPDRPTSARALFWNCSNQLVSEELAGDKAQLVELGSGKKRPKPKVLWSGSETLGRGDATVSLACPSGLMATAHESFTSAPQIATGTGSKWIDLTSIDPGLSTPARVQSIQWISDGFTVQGWLLLPQHVDGKLPMITTVHGGPAGASLPSFRGPGLQQELLERGYAIFYPNPRGSFGQGERFTAANVQDFGHGDLRDILAGVDAAEKLAPIDDARQAITGGSYGGFMTMWAVTQTHRFAAAVASAGVSNWQSYYGENGIDAWMLPYFGASVYKDPAVYAKSSPINFINNVRTPTFAYVGERDIECPAPQTQEFWHALKALGVPTAVMIYPGEGHGLRDPANTEDAMRRTLEWFDRYLK